MGSWLNVFHGQMMQRPGDGGRGFFRNQIRPTLAFRALIRPLVVSSLAGILSMPGRFIARSRFFESGRVFGCSGFEDLRLDIRHTAVPQTFWKH